MSARRLLFRLPLTGNHRRLRRQWCDERWTWITEWNGIVFTYESHSCLQHHDGRIRVWRHCGERLLNCFVMHRHTGPASGIMVWGGIGFQCRTPLVRIAGTLNSQRYISEMLKPVVLPYIQRLPSAIFQQDNVQSHMACNVQEFFFTHQTESLPWPACSPDLTPIENVWSMLAQQLAWDTLSAVTPDQLCQYVEAAWTAEPQGYIQSLFDSTPRRVAVVVANNRGYSNYRFCHHPHVTRSCNFNRLIFVKHVIWQINFAVIPLVLLGVAFCVTSSVYTLMEIKIRTPGRNCAR
ncbi:transposable element Tcb1 transposase [Trichonephila clavipes]|nr:transposable element Tcb1 transposase [Trichonephila clavipes]